MNENGQLDAIQLTDGDEDIKIDKYKSCFKYAVQIAVAVGKIAEGEKLDKPLIPIIREISKDDKYYPKTTELIEKIIDLSRERLSALEEEQAQEQAKKI